MAKKMNKEEMTKSVKETISKLKDKKFKVCFYVLDTKGNASSALEYIYQTALVLSKKGYDVVMIHDDDNFVGVEDWLGKEYAELKHANIKKDNVHISPADFLFVPEIFANVMLQTKNLPCKKVVIVQNASHICEFMPVSSTFENLNIIDAVVTTKKQEERLKDYFPMVRTHIVSPSIKKIFRNNADGERKMIVNVVSKDQTEINKLTKPFYWKNPLYKWVTFRPLVGVSQEAFAEGLREAAITIWMDDSTPFGYTLLEAMRCGGLVLAKMPDEFSDWMVDGESLTDGVLWFGNTDEVADMLPSIVYNWIQDKVPQSIYDNERVFDESYSEEEQEKEIEQVYVKELFEKRLNEFEEVLKDIENNMIKGEDD